MPPPPPQCLQRAVTPLLNLSVLAHGIPVCPYVRFVQLGAYLSRYVLQFGGLPIYCTGTSTVWAANDVCPEAGSVGTISDVKVALKEMRHEAQFRNEIQHRMKLREGHCDGAVMPLLRAHVPASLWGGMRAQFGNIIAEQRSNGCEYVLVMPLAHRNLMDIIRNENLAGP